MALTADQTNKLANVNPELRTKFTAVILACAARGVQVVIHWGYRSTAEQTRLWNNRKNNPNPVAKPGLSPHEWGVAIDATPLPRTAAAWGVLWDTARAQGLHLGKDFVRKDPPHFELTGFNHGSTEQKWPKPDETKHVSLVGNEAAVHALQSLDYLPDPFTVTDPNTRLQTIKFAVKKFQEAYNLTFPNLAPLDADGMAGPLTTAAMKLAAAQPAKHPPAQI